MRGRLLTPGTPEWDAWHQKHGTPEATEARLVEAERLARLNLERATEAYEQTLTMTREARRVLARRKAASA